jgi:hypothetical protein
VRAADPAIADPIGVIVSLIEDIDQDLDSNQIRESVSPSNWRGATLPSPPSTIADGLEKVLRDAIRRQPKIRQNGVQMAIDMEDSRRGSCRCFHLDEDPIGRLRVGIVLQDVPSSRPG